jgi:hypothetical protein
MKKFIPVILQLLILLSACTHHSPPLAQHVAVGPVRVRACTGLYVETEAAIVKAQVIDSEAARIPGYPYLRVNRLLSSFRKQVSAQQFDAWVSLMQQLARVGGQVEIANLPKPYRENLEHSIHIQSLAIPSLNQALHYCGNLLREFDLASKDDRDKLREKAVVPVDYRTWQRVVGLYPLTALAFKAGINKWQRETRGIFMHPLQQLPLLGILVQYIPSKQTPRLSATKVARIIKKSSNNPLHIPLPEENDQQRLLDSFAPIFEVDQFSGQDRIGTPAWQDEKYPLVNTTHAKVYRHVSHTRVENLVLLQLNYTIWFPSRPQTTYFDLLGGHLDGITWRVTLLPDGKPWLFDSIHNCGCYHLFFPTQHTRVLNRESLYTESAFSPQPSLSVDTPARQVIRIAANTHYIQRIYYAPAVADLTIQYHFETATRLRSLPLADGSFRSLYKEDGIVSGTERGERFLFWPMGIPNPGAMRQWGHHATAFVGRRHFDDARLFENTFAIVNATFVD